MKNRMKYLDKHGKYFRQNKIFAVKTGKTVEI